MKYYQMQKKKEVYDQWGEEGLKGTPPGESGAGFSTFSGFPGGGRTTFTYSPSDPDEIFRQFFGGRNPFGGGGGGRRGASGGMPGFNFMNFGDMEEDQMGRDEDGFGSFSGSARKKQAPVNSTFKATLEELFTGCKKKMKVTKKLLDPSGKTTPVEKILEIDVKPGWKTGTKITFPEEGDEMPGKIPADIIFVLEEKSHPIFTRDGDNLIITKTISLKEALTGTEITIPTIEGNDIKLPIREVISPKYERIVSGYGMPKQKRPTDRGNLIVRFNIEFPKSLNERQKNVIKEAL